MIDFQKVAGLLRLLPGLLLKMVLLCPIVEVGRKHPIFWGPCRRRRTVRDEALSKPFQRLRSSSFLVSFCVNRRVYGLETPDLYECN